MMEIIKITPVVVKIDKNKNKYIDKVSREPSPNNIYLVTATDTPNDASFGLMLNEVNIQSAYFTLENTDLTKLGKGDHKGSIKLKAHRMFILNEDINSNEIEWVEVSNKLPENPFDFVDYNLRYQKKVMELWKNKLPTFTDSYIRSAVTNEYSMQPQSLNILFFAPKTTYNKFQKMFSYHGLRFLEWVAKDILDEPFELSTESSPNDKIIEAYKSIGEGVADAEGYFYYKRNHQTINEYIVKRRKPSIIVNQEFNQFNINNGVYRVLVNNNYEYFAPNLLSNSETIGKVLGLEVGNDLLKKDFALKKNQTTPTYQDLIYVMLPLLESELDKRGINIERLDSDLNWVSIKEHGAYGQTNQDKLIIEINHILTPQLSEWGEKKISFEIDGKVYKERFNKASRLYWGLDLERLVDSVYFPYYTVCKKLHYKWIQFCNNRNIKIIVN